MSASRWKKLVEPENSDAAFSTDPRRSGIRAAKGEQRDVSEKLPMRNHQVKPHTPAPPLKKHGFGELILYDNWRGLSSMKSKLF